MMKINEHSLFLDQVVEMSVENLSRGRLPVAAVATGKDGVLARGYSNRGGVLDHAEIDCISNAGTHTTPKIICLYCTLEPCMMCLGAARNIGVQRVYYICDAFRDGATWCLSKQTDSTFSEREKDNHHFFTTGIDLVKIGDSHRKTALQLFEQFSKMRPETELSRYALGVFRNGIE